MDGYELGYELLIAALPLSIISGCITAAISRFKGHSIFTGFLLGFLLNVLGVFLSLFLRNKKKASNDQKIVGPGELTLIVTLATIGFMIVFGFLNQ